MSSPGPGPQNVGRWPVVAWALWDTGSTGMNAIVVTFVFSVYLTSAVGAGLPGPTTPASWLGRAMAAAGLTVAVLAPATGIWVNSPHRRHTVLASLTGLAVAFTATMSLVRSDYHYLWLGLLLMSLTAACGDLASVPYNAMLRELSTPQSSGRISGLGWAAGYFGSVLCLVVVYVGFIAGHGDTRGLLALPVADGLNVRVAMLMAAGWFLLFALPMLLTMRRHPAPEDGSGAVGFVGAYRTLWSEVAGEWRRDRNVVYYLVASAVFRDGLSGVFAFGAVLGVRVYGVSQADVLLFGISASLIAAAGAVLGGLLDDRLGSKPIIAGSLAAMIAVASTLMALSGPLAFWILGLMLCLFIGPIQASARTLLLRMAADGKEGVAFGLYTTTGRAVSFLAPWLFFVFIDTFGHDRAGMGGLVVVLAAGLIALLAVRAPHGSPAPGPVSTPGPTRVP
jgi:UMF1 family MFS transporter